MVLLLAWYYNLARLRYTYFYKLSDLIICKILTFISCHFNKLEVDIILKYLSPYLP
jgi:hypothetical protein